MPAREPTLRHTVPPPRSLKPSPTRVCLAVALILALALAVPAPMGSAEAAGTPTLPLAAGLEAEQRRGERLVQTLHLEQVLGPLAPVALSPFFALTCLSGASLLADSSWAPDWLTQSLRNNPILGTNSALNHGVVFLGLLALTLATTAPKLTKLTKPLAQAVDQLEAHAGIVALIAVQVLSRWQWGEVEPRAAEVVYQAGIISATAGTISTVVLAAFSALNIFVVNTVKFFFEVLVWLSPFPAVDAAFEAANKACAAFLVGLYLFSPWLATVVNLLIFFVCLVTFRWVRRRANYMRAVLGDPVLGWLAERGFRRPPATLTSTRLPVRIATQLPGTDLVLKAFVGAGLPPLKHKTRGFLVRAGDRLLFACPRWLRPPVIVPLPSTPGSATLRTGLLSNTLEMGTAAVLFTRRYNDLLDAIRQRLDASARAGTAPAPAARITDLNRAAAVAAQDAGGRASLREEFA